MSLSRARRIIRCRVFPTAHDRMVDRWRADGGDYALRFNYALGADPIVLDLPKVNIEGGEYELLERLIDTGLIGRIENLQIQLHDVAPDSARRMKRNHAGLKNTHAPVHQYRVVGELGVRSFPAAPA
jgi:hypothetical protein